MKRSALLLALAVFPFLASVSEARAYFSYSVCEAQTQCGYYMRDYYGRPIFIPTHPIACQVWAAADGSTACTYSWLFNSFVRCTGFNSAGVWVDTYLTCN